MRVGASRVHLLNRFKIAEHLIAKDFAGRLWRAIEFRLASIDWCGHGAATPTFEERHGFLSVTFPAQMVAGGTAPQETERVTGQVGEQVSEQVRAALEALAHGEKNKRELLEAMGLSDAYLNYKRHILPLLKRGLIEMTVPDKPRSRLQRYRLTPAGEKELKARSGRGKGIQNKCLSD